MVRGDGEIGADSKDVVPKLVCDTPPRPSLYLSTTYFSADHNRSKSVSVSGTYGARVRTVAERGGRRIL